LNIDVAAEINSRKEILCITFLETGSTVPN